MKKVVAKEDTVNISDSDKSDDENDGEGDEDYVVEKVLDKRARGGKVCLIFHCFV